MLCILAGYYIERFRLYSGKYARFFGNRVLRIAIIMILITACGIWSVPKGKKVVLKNNVLFMEPFDVKQIEHNKNE
jgi:hypothetical protein